MDEHAWDERYRSYGPAWDGKPNLQLVNEASDLVPGRALDAPAGEGGDAVWLAQRGWRVTAVDYSSVALERAERGARATGAAVAGRIDWLHRDLTTWVPPGESYDLVSVQFLHVPPAERELVIRHLATAVKPGGTLLVVGHHPSDLQTGVRRPRQPELLFTPDDVAALLDLERWEIAVSEVRPRSVTLPDGNPVAVHDSVLRARRRPRTD